MSTLESLYLFWLTQVCIFNFDFLFFVKLSETLGRLDKQQNLQWELCINFRNNEVVSKNFMS